MPTSSIADPQPGGVIPTRVHGLIDYAAGAALAAAPRAMGWHGATGRLMTAAAAGSAAYALATDYEWGVAPLLSMDAHLAIDAVQGAGFLGAALLLRREPVPARLAMAGYGLFALAVVALSERRPGR
ncbi:hypothetical protein [Azospirillum sp. ST 5-10]|uniref:hypothetical protein n=1 Tax=unclassified Azospirillum TaxID=2630922 RepID=UPI003F4A26A1